MSEKDGVSGVGELKAGRLLDALVAVRVMGLVPCTNSIHQRLGDDLNTCFAYPESPERGAEVAAYSTDIAAAWEIVNRISDIQGSPTKEFWFRFEKEDRRHQWYAEFSDPWSPRTGDTYPRFDAYAETAPLAICLAALATVEHSPESPSVVPVESSEEKK